VAGKHYARVGIGHVLSFGDKPPAVSTGGAVVNRMLRGGRMPAVITITRSV
jgi:hypothetical protein